jgi:hypothetical protein
MAPSHGSTWEDGAANRRTAYKQLMTVSCGCTLSVAINCRASPILGVDTDGWGKKLEKTPALMADFQVPSYYVLKIASARLNKIEKKDLPARKRLAIRKKFSEALPTVIDHVTPYMGSCGNLVSSCRRCIRVGATESRR